MQDTIAKAHRPEGNKRPGLTRPQRADRGGQPVLCRVLRLRNPARNPAQRSGQPQKAEECDQPQTRQHQDTAHVTLTSCAKFAPTAG